MSEEKLVFTGFEPKAATAHKMKQLVDMVYALQIEVEKLKLAAEPAKKAAKKSEE